MYGAIIGDIVGSYYEVLEVRDKLTREDKKRPYKKRAKILNKKNLLFTENSSYTDDTVLTVSIMDALIHDKNYEKYLKKYGLRELSLGNDKYGRTRFSKGFISWLKGEKEGKSYGNGAAMRISPIAIYFDSYQDIMKNVELATITSHNSEEAIIGAKAVACAIYMARHQELFTKDDIKRTIEENFGYNLDFNLKELQNTYQFTSRTKDSIPQAIFCFLESNSFEDTIRKSISIGGDTDTIASIACAISEQYYGIPQHLVRIAQRYIPEEYKEIINSFYYNVEFNRAKKELGITNPNFESYLRINGILKRYNIDPKEMVWAVFPQVNNQNILTGFRVLVPEIKDELSLRINLHEYQHAFELFNELNQKYEEHEEEREKRARDIEQQYLLTKKRQNS